MLDWVKVIMMSHKKKALLFTTLAYLIFARLVSAQSGVFDGGGSGGGVFGGISERLSSIFEGLFEAAPGGAIIPGITPIPEDGLPVDTGSGLPPGTTSMKQLKLSFEWDALSLGGETVEPVLYDPFLGMDNWYNLTDPDVNPNPSLPDLRSEFLLCPSCSGSAYDSAIIDEYNRVLPARSGEVLSAPPPKEPPRPNPPPPGGVVISPWYICPEQTDCIIANVERALTGWCGQEANLLNAERVPDISINSPGPNTFTLPNAVSNKYIRRDGYAYDCIRSCGSVDCVTHNYVEFQTEIYPSNAVSFSIRVENPTNLSLEDVIVRVNTLSYSPSGEYAVPHNLDMPYEITAETTAAGIDSVFQHNGFNYSHGSELGEKVAAGVNTLRTFLDTYGDPPVEYQIPLSLAERNSSTELLIGPFNIDAQEIIEFPLQPTTTEFSRIPDTLSSYDAGGINLAEPAIPCECQGVRLHRGTRDDPDCSVVITNPTIDQCRLYYGIGTPIPDHAGGFVCDQGGITAEGCPPPWCFERPEGNASYVGPMELCPGEALIELPEDEYWYFNVEFPPMLNYQENEDDSLMSKAFSVLKKYLPEEVIELYQPEKAMAYGCTQPCQNDPPPGMSGVGGYIPRDYNFICDPNDRLPNVETMYETARCEGTDPEVLLHPLQDDGVTPDPRFQVYRDVTGIGGCGYNASSNNSIIGPFQIIAEYGGTLENHTSRSVLVGSIPVGGRILDDQARPYGWPATGVIEELWGPTSRADGNLGRAVSSRNYGEYRYCEAGQY